MRRGSREHILSWTDSRGFYADFLQLVGIPECQPAQGPHWMPQGHAFPEEARLDLCGAELLPGTDCWDSYANWWLAYRPGANTPNWDVALTCTIKEKPGLILVEAKAHEGELDWAGKRLQADATEHSRSNHTQIGLAIAQASEALGTIVPGVSLSHDSHYQLANRIAHSWRLASLNIPVILVYLGFLGDSSVGRPLKSDSHWNSLLQDYFAGVIPEAFVDRWISCGPAEMRIIIRTRPAEGIA